MSILKILALRILQPLRIHHHSLLDMFPAQYQKLPDHLISNACGMVRDVCKLKTDSQPFS